MGDFQIESEKDLNQYKEHTKNHDTHKYTSSAFHIIQDSGPFHNVDFEYYDSSFGDEDCKLYKQKLFFLRALINL